VRTNLFIVMIWATVAGQLDQDALARIRGCSVAFPGKNVKRDDFFDSISASVELTLKADTRPPPPQWRNELYEIKSDRTNKLTLGILSQSDGTLISAMMMELR
jgi:hypothetical protein